MVERLTRSRRVAGLSLTSVTPLWPRAGHINPCLVLVHPRKTRPDITEKLLTGTKIIESNKKQNILKVIEWKLFIVIHCIRISGLISNRITFLNPLCIDWLKSLKQFINVSYLLVASLTLMALF